ncbi:glutamine synthetase [Sphaerisporangium flaviroseum]|uniref:Glutamine synthetase n=1 Tax=Sphaerisporangium flaviroseum TaxID=509199 RepID=A0ABP7HZC4_9ACTN
MNADARFAEATSRSANPLQTDVPSVDATSKPTSSSRSQGSFRGSAATLTAIVTSDLSGVCRGRAVPSRRLPQALDTGVGWVPANLAITPFSTLASPNPFGSHGDLRLIPDFDTYTELPDLSGNPSLAIMLADMKAPSGETWHCCPRDFLRRALDDLRTETGLTVKSTFEHEFVTLEESPRQHPFSLQAMLAGEPLGSRLVDALSSAGLEPETWLPEFGSHQWELTLQPAEALVSADRAILFRETVRHVARQLGIPVSFSPVPAPSAATSGVHIHLSLWTVDGEPATFDATRPGRLSATAGSFAAGILQHARALLALTAPSPLSYRRLRPGNWSAGRAVLADQDREALLRLPATVDRAGRNPASQLNLEYRAADATANPWIAMGALVRAGLEGLRNRLPMPPLAGATVNDQPASLQPEDLPRSLHEALQELEADETVTGWLPPDLLTTYLAVKREELQAVGHLDDEALCAVYADAY